MISARHKAKGLNDAIILIDEPEVGLHPSGARYLRDELIKISERNLVIYSTHSVFMIDSKCIGRHLIVRRNEEITTCTQAEASSIHDEEVLYSALGCSVFDSLRDSNLIVEGWRDKHLLDVATSRVPAKYRKVHLLKKVGCCFGTGVKNIAAIASFIQVASRECVILTDADDVAMQHKRSHERDRSFGKWLTFNDLGVSNDIRTAEDFVKPEHLNAAASKLAEKHGLNECPDFSAAGPCMEAIHRWLSANGMTAELLRERKNDFKQLVMDKLKTSHIKPEYYEYLEALAGHLKLT